MAHRVFTEELTFGDLIKDSIEIIKKNFNILIIFYLVFQLPMTLYSSFNPFSEFSVAINPSSIMKLLLFALIGMIGSIGVIKIIEDYIFEDKKSFGEYSNFSIKKFLPYLITSIVWTFALVLSFGMLVIPFFFMITLTMFTTFIVVLRGIYNPFEAMKYSYNITKGRGLRTFGYGLSILIVYGIIVLILNLIPVGFNPDILLNPTVAENNPTLNIIVSLLSSVINIFLLCFFVLMMINLEAEKGYYIDESKEV